MKGWTISELRLLRSTLSKNHSPRQFRWLRSISLFFFLYLLLFPPSVTHSLSPNNRLITKKRMFPRKLLEKEWQNRAPWFTNTSSGHSVSYSDSKRASPYPDASRRSLGNVDSIPCRHPIETSSSDDPKASIELEPRWTRPGRPALMTSRRCSGQSRRNASPPHPMQAWGLDLFPTVPVARMASRRLGKMFLLRKRTSGVV